MVDIQKLRRFLSNDFRNAILSIKKIDEKLILRLTLSEKTKLTGNYLDIYSEDLNEIRNNPIKLCNYMLEIFLSNHTIIGVNYFSTNSYHPDKICFDIITTEGIFTIALGNCDVKEIFPNFIKDVELVKRQGVLKELLHRQNGDVEYPRQQLFLSLNEHSSNIKTGIEYYNYGILSYPKNDKIIIPEYEEKFVILFIQELMRIYQITEQYYFEELMDKIKSKKNDFSDPNRSRYSSRELCIGNIIFDFYKDEKSLMQIELIQQAVKKLESEFQYKSNSDFLESYSRQLVIENYNGYGGRK